MYAFSNENAFVLTGPKIKRLKNMQAAKQTTYKFSLHDSIFEKDVGNYDLKWN